MILCLHLLNFSVDTSSLLHRFSELQPSFNYQESFAEIFVEKVLGADDFFTEYNDSSEEDNAINKTIKLNLFYHTYVVSALGHALQLLKEINSSESKNLKSLTLQRDTPPPKLVFS